jgi:ADP-heptose:LPS heptosyltransferase
MKLALKLWLDFYVGGALLALLKLPTMLLGALMGRDHKLDNCKSITFIKMQGGGSLVIAYPTLLAIRRLPRIRRMQLVTTPAIRHFADTLGIFDEVIVIDDRGLGPLLASALRAARRLFATDLIVDLEIYSRLTTIFALLVCARNRVSFYTNASFWRKNISTHLIFTNISRGIYDSYDHIAKLLGATIPEIADCRSQFRAEVGITESQPPVGVRRIGVAAGCSDLSRERMLRPEEWAAVLRSIAAEGSPCEFQFLGGKGDVRTNEEIIAALGPGFVTVNYAGVLPLRESVRQLAALERLVCIDSSMLHYARLLGTPVQAYFGPTSPEVLLRPMPNPDRIFYTPISCSPCVHLANVPPCHGNNLCMRLAFDPQANVPRNPMWVE